MKLKDMGEVENAMAELLRLTIERDGVHNQMEAERARIADQYAAPLANLDACIQEQRQALDLYLADHKPDFAALPRSRTFVSGSLGYRKGNPCLKPLPKWTWKKVLQNLIDTDRNWFIRREPEVAKDAIMLASDVLGTDGLKEIGLKIDQEDRPFIELAREPIPEDASRGAA